MMEQPVFPIPQIRPFFFSMPLSAFPSPSDNIPCSPSGHKVEIHDELSPHKKKKHSITFTLDRICHAFMGLCEVSESNCEEWDFVPTSQPQTQFAPPMTNFFKIFLMFIPCIVYDLRIHTVPCMGRVGQSVQRLATGWTARGSNFGGGEIFRTCPDQPWGPPSLLDNGYRVLGVKSGRDVTLNPHPLRVPFLHNQPLG